MMSKVADGVPALVSSFTRDGVVNVMGSVGQPPAVLGKMIYGALVNFLPFSGIRFLWFCRARRQPARTEGARGRRCISASRWCCWPLMSGYAPQVAVEFGRKVLESGVRPTFIELEEGAQGP